MRKPYMTMFFKDNTEVTYIVENGEIVVMYEKAVMNGFHRVDIKLDGTVVFEEGFSPTDIDYFIDFTLQNAPVLESLVNDDL